MLLTFAKLDEIQKLIISTGNILNADSATPLRRSNEELLESLKLCTEYQHVSIKYTDEMGRPLPAGMVAICVYKTGYVQDLLFLYSENTTQMLNANKDLQMRIKEFARNEISIGVKLFFNKSSKQGIKEAVDALRRILNVDRVDNVVLAFHPLETASRAVPVTPDVASAVSYTGDMKWSSRNNKYMGALKDMWSALEEYNEKKEICQLGIADLDYEALNDLHRNARVPPVINQINLANCCAVPSELKEFCNQHDIQLLTHSDPEILINDEDFMVPNFSVDWSLRYQIHVRCRGVLTAKGYILQASKGNPGCKK